MKQTLAAILLLVGLPAFAQTLGGVCVPYQSINSKGVNADFLWRCEQISDPVTVKGIYEKGFKVVAFVGLDWKVIAPSLVIEQQSTEKKQ